MKALMDMAKVEKEDIPFLHFPKEEVLFSKDDRLKREKQLEKAIHLGNLDHHKVKLVFEDVEGLKYVETTIWAVTDESILLKKGVTIPKQRIHEIKFI